MCSSYAAYATPIHLTHAHSIMHSIHLVYSDAISAGCTGTLCRGRSSTSLQDPGLEMGHLWFVVQIWAKWS